MKDMESIYDANALLNAFRESKKGTSWLLNINQTQKEIANGTYEQKDFYEFPLNE